MAKAQVIVYSRPGCHLCEEAKETMLRSANAANFELTEINIETSAELLEKYRFDIPVVTINGEEAFRHRVDTERFREILLGRR